MPTFRQRIECSIDEVGLLDDGATLGPTAPSLWFAHCYIMPNIEAVGVHCGEVVERTTRLTSQNSSQKFVESSLTDGGRGHTTPVFSTGHPPLEETS